MNAFSSKPSSNTDTELRNKPIIFRECYCTEEKMVKLYYPIANDHSSVCRKPVALRVFGLS